MDISNGTSFKGSSIPLFLSESNELVTRLAAKSAEEISRFMRISPALAKLNKERLDQWRLPFPGDKTAQAILAFKGDVYEAMRADSFTAADAEFAVKHLRILSGMYGLLRPLDQILPYRLEISARLANSVGKDLYCFWKDRITFELNRTISEHNLNYLVNLSSAEYFKAIDTASLHYPVIHVVFRQKSGNVWKTIGNHIKRARGLMTNYIVKNRIAHPDGMKDFHAEGYRYSNEATSGNNWVFLRY